MLRPFPVKCAIDGSCVALTLIGTDAITVRVRAHAKQLVLFAKDVWLDQGYRAELLCAAAMELAFEGNSAPFDPSQLVSELLVCAKQMNRMRFFLEDRLRSATSFVDWRNNGRRQLLTHFPAIMDHLKTNSDMQGSCSALPPTELTPFVEPIRPTGQKRGRDEAIRDEMRQIEQDLYEDVYYALLTAAEPNSSSLTVDPGLSNVPESAFNFPQPSAAVPPSEPSIEFCPKSFTKQYRFGKGWNSSRRSQFCIKILATWSPTTDRPPMPNFSAKPKSKADEMLEAEYVVICLMQRGIDLTHLISGFCSHLQCRGRFLCADISLQVPFFLGSPLDMKLLLFVAACSGPAP